MERVAHESWRTGTSKTPFVIVTLSVFATRRPRAFIHVMTSGAVRIARVPFRAFTVVSARKVCTQRTGTASVRQTTLVYIQTLFIKKNLKNKYKILYDFNIIVTVLFFPEQQITVRKSGVE